MPLSLFQHESLSYFREAIVPPDKYEHTFGGDPESFGIRFANCEPLHLLYRLNQADPFANLNINGVTWLPLIYHFAYASQNGDLTYRITNDAEIEVLDPADAEFDPNYPYPNYPSVFPECRVALSKQKYDPSIAEDALSLAGIFGVDHLPKDEMLRAVKIVGETSSLFKDWGSKGIPGIDFPEWSPEDLVRREYCKPFLQTRPSRECKNPNCTARVLYRTEAMEIPVDEEFIELLGTSTLTLDARDVREDSLRVFALHQPEKGERLLWHDHYMQLVYQVCECCKCIRVTNQCD